MFTVSETDNKLIKRSALNPTSIIGSEDLGDISLNHAIAAPAMSIASVVLGGELDGDFVFGESIVSEIGIDFHKVETVSDDLSGGKEKERFAKRTGVQTETPTDLPPEIIRGGKI